MGDSKGAEPDGSLRPALIEVSFPDGSRFSLPREWEDIVVDAFGHNPDVYGAVAERLRFVTGKYVEHRAWPTKFDGIIFTEGPTRDEWLDDPDFYWEHWEEWGDEGRQWGNRVIREPTWADVADGVMYKFLRPGILQKALQAMAEERGVPAPRVVSPERFLTELEDRKRGS
jgi:hypothetical protein